MAILHIPITDEQQEVFTRIAEHQGRTKKSLQLQWITEALNKSEAKMHKSSGIMKRLKSEVNE